MYCKLLNNVVYLNEKYFIHISQFGRLLRIGIVIITLLFIVILIRQLLFFNKSVHYNDSLDTNKSKIIVYTKQGISQKFKFPTKGNSYSYFEIYKTVIEIGQNKYDFDIAGHEIYTLNSDFIFSKVKYNTNLIKCLGMNIPQHAHNGVIYTLKHNTSAVFPTLYFYISENNHKKFSTMKISWP